MELKTYTEEELARIIEKHQKWLADKDDPDGERANLTSADLRYANLTYANLRYANLRYANLTSADLTSANLTYADLRYANLRYANLRSANLTSANLTYADLTSANLTYADLRSADLTSANLRYADLRSANLTYANLRYANLRYANLTSANLTTYRQDLILSILGLPDEIPFLRQRLVDGKIDGTCYEGSCTCLAGTMAKACGLAFGDFKSKQLMPIAADSPRELWFYNILRGHTAENSAVVRLTLEWIDEALSLVSRIRGVPNDAAPAVSAEGSTPVSE